VKIIGSRGESYIIDMVEGTCKCRRWELIGLPCSHGISVIYGNNQQPEEFVHGSYLVSTYMRVYDHFINPTNSEKLWTKFNDGTSVIPPPIGRIQREGKQKQEEKSLKRLKIP